MVWPLIPHHLCAFAEFQYPYLQLSLFSPSVASPKTPYTVEAILDHLALKCPHQYQSHQGQNLKLRSLAS